TAATDLRPGIVRDHDPPAPRQIARHDHARLPEVEAKNNPAPLRPKPRRILRIRHGLTQPTARDLIPRPPQPDQPPIPREQPRVLPPLDLTPIELAPLECLDRLRIGNLGGI